MQVASKVDIRLHGNGIQTSMEQSRSIISMIEWIRTSGLSIQTFLCMQVDMGMSYADLGRYGTLRKERRAGFEPLLSLASRQVMSHLLTRRLRACSPGPLLHKGRSRPPSPANDLKKHAPSFLHCPCSFLHIPSSRPPSSSSFAPCPHPHL